MWSDDGSSRDSVVDLTNSPPLQVKKRKREIIPSKPVSKVSMVGLLYWNQVLLLSCHWWVPYSNLSVCLFFCSVSTFFGIWKFKFPWKDFLKFYTQYLGSERPISIFRFISFVVMELGNFEFFNINKIIACSMACNKLGLLEKIFIKFRCNALIWKTKTPFWFSDLSVLLLWDLRFFVLRYSLWGSSWHVSFLVLAYSNWVPLIVVVLIFLSSALVNSEWGGGGIFIRSVCLSLYLCMSFQIFFCVTTLRRRTLGRYT